MICLFACLWELIDQVRVDGRDAQSARTFEAEGQTFPFVLIICTRTFLSANHSREKVVIPVNVLNFSDEEEIFAPNGLDGSKSVHRLKLYIHASKLFPPIDIRKRVSIL